jgi:ABC-type phosphate transport system substrate-binding protein
LTGGTALRIAVLAVTMIGEPGVQTRQGAPAFVVVVNKANPVKTLSVLELRRIFMKQTRMWSHAESMVPVDWDATSPHREEFSRLVLGRTVREMGDYWVQQGVTQGLTPPSTQRSTRAMLRFVASVPGAIGYVPAAEVDDTVVAVKITGLP